MKKLDLSTRLRSMRTCAAAAFMTSVMAAVPAAVAAPIIIDDFSDTQSGVTGDALQTITGLGLERDVNFDDGLGGTWTVAGGLGTFSPVTSSGELELNYDGVLGGDSATLNVLSLGSVDLTMGGSNNRFELVVSSAGSMTALIRTFTDTTGNFYNFPFEITGPGTYTKLFTDIGGTVGTPSLTNVDAVYLWLGTTATSLSDHAIDEPFSLDLFQVTGPSGEVPEPGTFVLLGVGLGALALWRKRRAA